MPDTNAFIISSVLQEEETFRTQLRRRIRSIDSETVAAELSDYLAALEDLRQDFLIPAQTKAENEIKHHSAGLISDRYWFFRKL